MRSRGPEQPGTLFLLFGAAACGGEEDYGMGAAADRLLEVVDEVGVLLLLFKLGLHIRLRSILA